MVLLDYNKELLKLELEDLVRRKVYASNIQGKTLEEAKYIQEYLSEESLWGLLDESLNILY